MNQILLNTYLKKIIYVFATLELVSLILIVIFEPVLSGFLIISLLNIIFAVIAFYYFKTYTKKSEKVITGAEGSSYINILGSFFMGCVFVLISVLVFKLWTLAIIYFFVALFSILLRKRLEAFSRKSISTPKEKRELILFNRIFFTLVFLQIIPFLLDIQYNILQLTLKIDLILAFVYSTVFVGISTYSMLTA